MPSLNNVTTTDGYTDANTLQCAGSSGGRIQVNNAAIYMIASYVTGVRGAGDPPKAEEFLLPGIHPIAPTSYVRVRSAVVGKPAQVSIDV